MLVKNTSVNFKLICKEKLSEIMNEILSKNYKAGTYSHDAMQYLNFAVKLLLSKLLKMHQINIVLNRPIAVSNQIKFADEINI